MIIGITGQRLVNNLSISPQMQKHIASKLKEKFVELKATRIIAGGAIGSDTIAAEVAIEVGIALVIACPFAGQELLWGKSDQERYNEILSHADSIEVISSGHFANFKYFVRNQWIVDNCDTLVAVLDVNTKRGGTFSTVEYCRNKKKNVIIIDPLAP